ncbi:hypothetical protein DCAR_0623519 [Daucus carota subsp. sativus]|uniref:Replication protein A OB domain-containing protein n=1 Tax=Daucus carota subsp. sativus TaxID=79200 RepID=A0A161ZQU2_DAUCS|nr:hypothetical protein DCAR_0623519 [Daucus carota subsp. sativus]
MQTTVSRSSEAYCDIPRYKFEFAQMDEIIQRAEEYNSEQTFALDVIGVVENIQPLQIVNTPRGTVRLIRIILGDGFQSISIHLWGDITNDVLPIHHDVLERPVILILSSVIVRNHSGNVVLMNIPATSVYTHLGVQAVFNMRERLDRDGYEDMLDV